jgi:hypothetical protein
MHRVYNSAFMNMLRDERNSEYRQLIRSTLEFDPQILKRYVNFMSNPDERTAVDQFDTGDKYFGVATLMATMPGLPMFGHGQIEGLAEKYGMEFRRPRWDETPNEGLVWRHQLQLFPLLRRRRIFAEVDRFLFYDFVADDGSVDENVFAYSNDIDGERSLVVYHNRYAETRGRLRLSTAVAERSDGDQRNLVRTSLGDGLRLPEGDDQWVVYRDAVTGLEHLRSCRDLRSDGWHFELDAYRLHCLLDFRELIEDEDHPWRELANQVDERGVRSIDDALGQMRMAAVLEPFRRLLSGAMLERLASDDDCQGAGAELLEIAQTEVTTLFTAVALEEKIEVATNAAHVESHILNELETVIELARLARGPKKGRGAEQPWKDEMRETLGDPATWATLLAWVIARHLGGFGEPVDATETARVRFGEWHLGSTLIDLVMALGHSENDGRRSAETVELMIGADPWKLKDKETDESLNSTLAKLVGSDAGRHYLRVNSHADVLWFNREAFEELVRWLTLIGILDGVAENSGSTPSLVAEMTAAWEKTLGTAENSGYRVVDFLETLNVANETLAADD